MTSPSDRDRHPDVEEISDYTEGLLPPSRTAEIGRHLDECADCADIHRSLREIRNLLGTLPASSPIPTDVAERIDAALAAEALLDSTRQPPALHGPRALPENGAADDRSSATVERLGRGDARSDGQATEPEEAGTASEAVSTVGGPHVSRETSRSSRTPGTQGRSTTGPGRNATGPGRTPRRRRSVALGAALGVAVIGASVLLFQGTDGKTPVTSADRPASSRASATANADEFSGSRLETRVDTLLTAKPSGTPRSAPGTQSNSADTGAATNQPLMQALPEVPRCVQQGTGRTEAVLAAQQGTYRGTPAYLLVLANPSDDTTVRVYVIDSSCVGATPPVKGAVLETETLPRR
ncbi:zf-HC2 domain-containing protein [Streptomyces tremellae]|uniref:Putative zinc-finger domain-containing protein n=1 Tax=Streptomyces tremellae TaxID=1124239 RepID=A0ABP7ET88_9ACTN